LHRFFGEAAPTADRVHLFETRTCKQQINPRPATRMNNAPAAKTGSIAQHRESNPAADWVHQRMSQPTTPPCP
jgi:hypothetical protein